MGLSWIYRQVNGAEVQSWKWGGMVVVVWGECIGMMKERCESSESSSGTEKYRGRYRV